VKAVHKITDLLKVKIKSKDDELNRVLINAFSRSLLCYHMTPLVAAGMIKKSEILSIEQTLTRGIFGCAPQFSNQVLKNVFNYWAVPAAEDIALRGSRTRRRL
jgi:hypothetical protein